MKIYIDCSVHNDKDTARRKQFDVAWHALSDSLSAKGFEILNFETPSLPFDPFAAEISDFVKIAHAVVALDGYPSSGFSAEVTRASDEFCIPRFLFAPGEVNLFTRKAPFRPHVFRCLFHTPTYPAEALQDYFSGKLGPTTFAAT